MSSVTINCNEFGDTIKEIIGLMIPEKKSNVIGWLELFSKISICTNIDNLENSFYESSEEYNEEIKRLFKECKDSICNGKDKIMTITCDTIRIFSEQEDIFSYEEMKKECQQIRKQIDDNKDIIDIVSSLIDETGLNIYENEILKRLKDIPKEKFEPIKQLISLMLKCTCQIDIDKKGVLSTTVIIIIVVSILLLLCILAYFFLM